MKKIVLLVVSIVFIIGTVEAQSEFQKFFWSKRYKKCLAERDQLLAENKNLKKDTLDLHTIIKSKNRKYDSLLVEYNKLNASYKYLMSSSDKKVSELNSSLENKLSELSQREKDLKEKDKQLKELQSLLKKQDSILNALNNTVKNALLGFKSDEFMVEMKNGKVYVSISDKLLFKSGNATVEDKGKDAIKKLSEVLNKNSEIDIAIEGHTDNVPIKTAIYKDNWDLSVARSTNIVRMICDEFNVEPKRVTASGKGEHFPVANNDTPEGRAKNRRTEIVLSPKLEELFKLLNSGKKN